MTPSTARAVLVGVAHTTSLDRTATLIVASGLLLVLWLFGRAALIVGHLIRESASFLSAVEPMLGIADWMSGH